MPKLSISRILVPVDFSARTDEAVRYAARLARHFRSQLTLLHVVEPPHAGYAMVELPDYLDRAAAIQQQNGQRGLAACAAGDLDGLDVVRTVVQGKPDEEILAQSAQADLVVMPTQGHSRIREFLIGSVTAKVLHDCARPVLTGVHLTENQIAGEWQVKNILCAIDFGPESDNILRWAAFFAAEVGATISVVHADSDETSGHLLQRSIEDAGLTATPIVKAGEPHKVVTDVASRLGADLVIIGRGSNTTALGRLRAQAYEIVRKSPCPVLSV